MEFSYWERRSFLGNTKYCIIGGGIVGLSTALHLAQKLPAEEIVVFEKSPFSGGGSTKNAGFACFGSPTEVLSDLQLMSKEECADLIRLRFQGLKLLRTTLGDENIDYQNCGGLELFTRNETKEGKTFERVLESVPMLNAFMEEAIGEKEVYQELDLLEKNYGLEGMEGGINNRLEGAIDTGKMMKSLTEKVTDLGVRIVRGMELLRFDEQDGGVNLHFDYGKISCEQLFICTNSMSQSLLPKLDVHPGRNTVLLTSPISDLKLKGTFHMFEGYVYFRNIDNRLLLGGGRHWAGPEENTLEHGSNPIIEEKLLNLLQEELLLNSHFDIDYRWSGFLGLGNKKSPIIQKVGENSFCAIRMGGMGVAIGSEIGRQLAELFFEEHSF
jgi:gamma-glutamylputrescine oxidase